MAGIKRSPPRGEGREPRKLDRTGQRAARPRTGAPVKNLLCYLLAWGWVALWVAFAFLWIYPHRLVHTAPNLVEGVTQSLPGGMVSWMAGRLPQDPAVQDALRSMALELPPERRQGLPEGLRSLLTPEETQRVAAWTGAELRGALETRDRIWLLAVFTLTLLCAVLTLCVQLLWRGRFRGRLMASRTAISAVRWYRLMMVLVALLNAGAAALLYRLGVRWIAGRTLWDVLMYFGAFLWIPLAAGITSRLAAHPSISGRHCFFVRL